MKKWNQPLFKQLKQTQHYTIHHDEMYCFVRCPPDLCVTLSDTSVMRERHGRLNTAMFFRHCLRAWKYLIAPIPNWNSEFGINNTPHRSPRCEHLLWEVKTSIDSVYLPSRVNSFVRELRANFPALDGNVVFTNHSPIIFLPERVFACSYVKLGSMHGMLNSQNYLSPHPPSTPPPNSLTIQREMQILRGIDINSPHYWSKQFGMFKKDCKPRPHCRKKVFQNKLTICLFVSCKPAQRTRVNCCIIKLKAN